MSMNTLSDLLEDCIKDLYSAEQQIIKALPKMIKRTSNPQLRTALQEHLQQTEGQLERLNRIAEQLGFTPRGKKCSGMEGLIEEGKELLEEEGEPAIIDAAIIGAAQKVEHYEISAYGTARTFAEELGHTEVVSQLEETLEEESATDERLTMLSMEQVLPNVPKSEEDEGGEQEGEEATMESDEEAEAGSGGGSSGGGRRGGRRGGGSQQ